MSEDKKFRPKARIPRGFRDRGPDEIAAERRMLDVIRGVFESYGFEALETPSFEYADALGKFLPDQDRPNEGAFSLADDDKQWLALRYDLTAPLARYVAENFQDLPKPFRRYQVGTVWRNEKPGPGRYREFTQFDADTVGSASPAADAELIMMTCDALEALGLKRGEYIVKLNSRKLLDGVLDEANVDPSKRGAVMRALDKLDRFAFDGVAALLGSGRTDQSGDVTPGAGLSDQAITRLLAFVGTTETGSSMSKERNNLVSLANFKTRLQGSAIGIAAIEELSAINEILSRSGYSEDRILIDPSVIRGLEYYTGPVFEAQVNFPVKNKLGQTVVMGSLAGGGRYDDLVARFVGQQVPAVGVSIGVSRLLSVLKGKSDAKPAPLVVVLALDDVQNSFRMASELRNAGIRAEAYVGTKKFGDQLKYADKRGAAIAVIEGSDERVKGEVTLKDLALGAELAKSVESRAAWVKDRPAQITVKRAQLVPELRKLLGR
jgi:histidyl-tRNA synthetase